MADLGNLFFKMHISDMSNSDLDKLIENIQTRLESKKVKLGIDYDQSAVNQIASKVKDVKKKVSQATKSNKSDDSLLPFDEKKAAAQAETIHRTYKSMFDKIAAEEKAYEKSKGEKRVNLKRKGKEIYYASKQDRLKADADRFADSYYKKLRRESRTLGRELDAMYVKRKAGLIGGEKTDKAISLMKNKMAELYKAEQAFKKDGTFDRGIFQRINDGDYKDSVRQAKAMIDAEKKLNAQKRRNDAESVKAEKERLDRINKMGLAIQQQQVQKQKALDFEKKQADAQRKRDDAEIKRLIKKEEIEKRRESDRLARSMKGHIVEGSVYDSVEYKNSMNQMRAFYKDKERFAKDYKKAQDEYQKQKEKDKRTDAKISAQLEKEERRVQKEHNANLEKQARAIQQQQVQKQKALDFEKKQADAQRKRDDAEIKRLIKKEEIEKRRKSDRLARSMKGHIVEGSVYDSVEYKNSMANMRGYYNQLAAEEKKKADAKRVNDGKELSAAKKKANELQRIYSEIRKFDNEIAKLNIGQRTGALKGHNITEAIRGLEEYKRKLNEALTAKDRSKIMGEIKSGVSTAELNRARLLAREQRELNAERKRASIEAKRQRNEINRLNAAYKSESRILDQVRNQLFNVFSIYQAERFLRSVIEIGGEFQKQRIALRAILNDSARADVMFGKIKSLAIDSPFNFRELMGYTKQIAAFGIPYEEMYDTTKRLADISAGLGVDMGRIILAYGQVRSAAVLRGLSVTGSSATYVVQNENSFNCWNLCA